MEIILRNEQYNFSDITALGWIVSGNVNKDVQGSVNINLTVHDQHENHIGNLDYNYPINNGSIYKNINVNKNFINDFDIYINSIIDEILTFFNVIS